MLNDDSKKFLDSYAELISNTECEYASGLPVVVKGWALNEVYDSFDFPVRPKFGKCDWLSATCPNIKQFHWFSSHAIPKLQAHGLRLHDTGRGRNGYDHCFNIMFNGGVCGSFLADSSGKMGGMFELTGFGCDVLEVNWVQWCRLMLSLKDNGFGITRLDVCCDFKGAAWQNYDVNICDLLEDAGNGMFTVGRGGGVPPVIDTHGPWEPIITGKIPRETYNPSVHAPEGLSFSVGKRATANSFMVYEKGKEMLGKGMFEYITDTTARHVRIERRFKRGQGRSRVIIPFDFAMFPDKSFVYNCSGLNEFVTDYFNWLNDSGVDGSGGSSDDKELSLVHVGYGNSVMLIKKAFWGARHAGRLIRTLIDVGLSDAKIVAMLAAPEGLKGFIGGLTDFDQWELEFSRIQRGLLHGAS